MDNNGEQNSNGNGQSRFELPPITPEVSPDPPAETTKPKRFVEAWEQQDGESAKAFEAFSTHRDAGESRSNAKTAQALGKSKTLIDRWSSRWKWVDRVLEWDREQDRIHVLELRRERKNASRRHASQFKQLQQVAAKALIEAFGEDLENVDAETLTVDQMLRIFDVASKGERLALGEPDSIAETILSGGRPSEGDDDERQPIPLTFNGRVDEALALLETARERAALETSRESD